jgi:hypothetical protein
MAGLRPEESERVGRTRDDMMTDGNADKLLLLSMDRVIMATIV